MANMAKKFSLNDWAGEYGLNAPTVDALTEEKLVELEVLTELTEDEVWIVRQFWLPETKVAIYFKITTPTDKLGNCVW